MLLGLQNATPAISNVGRYAKIVQDTASLRRLIAVASDIAEMAYLEPDDVRKAIDSAEQKVFDIAEQRDTDSTRPINELLSLVNDHLEANYGRGDTITGTATGLTDLDELLLGLQPSTLNIIGARPAMGKSALAIGIATHVAQNTRLPVMVFSLEMGHLELAQRILSWEARVDSKKLRTGNLSETDWTKIGRAIGRLEVPLMLDDNPSVTVMEIRAKARRVKARDGGLGLIVIDYLQLMTGSTGAENRQLEVSEISRNLKILARELEVPSSRSASCREPWRAAPTSDRCCRTCARAARWSRTPTSSCSSTATRCTTRTRKDQGMAELIVAKHRAGATGTCHVVFLGPYTRFDNAAPRAMS